jgi:hypothetical protein
VEQKTKVLSGEIPHFEEFNSQYFPAINKKIPIFMFYKEFLLAIQKNSLLKTVNFDSVTHLEEIVNHYDEIIKYYHFSSSERSEFLEQLRNPDLAQIRSTLEKVKNCIAIHLNYAQKCQYYRRHDYWQGLKLKHEKNPSRLKKILRLQQAWILQGDYTSLPSIKLVQLIKIISWAKQYITAALMELSQIQVQDLSLLKIDVYKKYAEYLQLLHLFFDKEIAATAETIFNRLEVAFCNYDLRCDDVLWGLRQQLAGLGLEELTANVDYRRGMNANILYEFLDFIFSQGQACIDRLLHSIAKIVPEKYMLKRVCYDGKWLMLPECFIGKSQLQLTLKEKNFFEDRFNRVNGLVNIALLVNNGGASGFFNENHQVRLGLMEKSILACEAMFEELQRVSFLVQDEKLVSDHSFQWVEIFRAQCLEVFDCLINRIDGSLDCFLSYYEHMSKNFNINHLSDADECIFKIIVLLNDFFIKISEKIFQYKIYDLKIKLTLVVEASQKYLLKGFLQKIQMMSQLHYLPFYQGATRVCIADLQKHLGSLGKLMVFLNEKNKQIVRVIMRWCEGCPEGESFSFVESLGNLFSILMISEVEKQTAIDFIIKGYLLPQLTEFDSSLGNVIRLLKGERWYKSWQIECENKIKQMDAILRFIFESKPELMLGKYYRIDFPQCTIKINFYIIKSLLLKLRALKNQQHFSAKNFYKVIQNYLVCYEGDNDRYMVLFELLADADLLQRYVLKFFSSNLNPLSVKNLLNSKDMIMCFRYTAIKQVCGKMLFDYVENFFSQSDKTDIAQLVFLYDSGFVDLMDCFSDDPRHLLFSEEKDLRIFRHLRMIFSFAREQKHAENLCRQLLSFCQKYSVRFPVSHRVQEQWCEFLDVYQRLPWNDICYRLIERFADVKSQQKYCLKWLEDFLCPRELQSPVLILPCESFVAILLDSVMAEQVLQIMDLFLKRNLKNILHQESYNAEALEYVGQILAFEFMGAGFTERFIKIRQQYQFFCKLSSISAILHDQVLDVVNLLQLRNYLIVVDFFKNYFHCWISIDGLNDEDKHGEYLSFFAFWYQLARVLKLQTRKLLYEFVDWLNHNLVHRSELIQGVESLKKWIFLYLSQASLMQNNQEILAFLNAMAGFSRLPSPCVVQSLCERNTVESLFSAVDVRNLAVLIDYLQCFSLTRFDPQIWRDVSIRDLQINITSQTVEISNALIAIIDDFLSDAAPFSYPACFYKFLIMDLFQSPENPLNNEWIQHFSKWLQCLLAIMSANPFDRSSALWHRFAELLNVVVGVMQKYESCCSKNNSSRLLIQQIRQLEFTIKRFLDDVFLAIVRQKNDAWAYSLTSMRLIYQSNSVYFEKILVHLPVWAQTFCASPYVNQLFGLNEAFVTLSEEMIEIELEKNMASEDVLGCKAVFDIAKALWWLQGRLKISCEVLNFQEIDKCLSFLFRPLCYLKDSFSGELDKQYDDIFTRIVHLRSSLSAQKVLHFKETTALMISGASLIFLDNPHTDDYKISAKVLDSKNIFFSEAREKNSEAKDLKRIIAAIVALTFEGLQRFDQGEDFQMIVDSLCCYCGQYLYCFMDPLFFHQHVHQFVDKLSKACVNQLVEKKLSAKISFVVNNYNPYALFKNRKFIYSSPSINCEKKDREAFKKIIGEIGLQVCQAYGLRKTLTNNRLMF